MAYYDKKVVYLSEMEYGSKIKGAGFVRMEFRDEACSLDMYISGVTELSEKKYDIYVISVWGEEYKVGTIYIHNGKGEWQKSYENGCQGFQCTEIAELIIKVSDAKIISGTTGFRKNHIKAAQIVEQVDIGEQIWSEEKLVEQEDTRESGKEETRKQKEMDNHEIEEKKSWEERKGRRWEFRRGMPQSMKMEETVKQEKDSQSSKQQEFPVGNEEIQMDAIILSDKWDQLRQIYPVVHPYEDEREYISIQPKDFVIMTGDYQHLANNSFLLHGFYNYRHIILGRELDESFYLGAPGVYYEREKMVALMFGFEAFECKGGNVEAGKFGYYLRKVKI